MDKWEWSDGMVPRFGIVHHDHATHRRTVKPSGRMLARIIEQQALTRETIQHFTAGQEYRRSPS